MPLPGRREEFRRHPLGLIGRDAGQAAQIDRIELHGSHVEKFVVEIVGDLGDDLRLADAAGAPDMQGHTFANQRMKRFIELRRFHGISWRVSYWMEEMSIVVLVKGMA